MLDKLIHALVESENEAADDLLLEALGLGNDREKTVVLDALMRRQTLHGLGGVVAQFAELPESLRLRILKDIKSFHPALRECGRSTDIARRLGAIRLIALGKQGRLSYVVSENLHETDEQLQRGAIEALVALARWVAVETRRVQGSPAVEPSTDPASTVAAASSLATEPGIGPRELLEQRPEIEQAVARAIDVYRGKFGQDLLRAAMLLCDWPGSKTLEILRIAKHGGQSAMIRRLEQPPASEHVEAFLLGASHGGVRQHFGIVFSHITEPPVLDALLRKTYWLKDNQLQLCMHQVTRGVWFNDGDLVRDIERRSAQTSLIGEWIVAAGLNDVGQDERLQRLLENAANDFAGRVRLFRLVAQRPRGASLQIIRNLLNDADERLQRMAAREIVRRNPPDAENILLQMMTSVPDSVRRVIGRALGESGFENFWDRFDDMDKPTRKSAGTAMLKLLADAPQRLSRLMSNGPVQQRLKAMQVVQELEMAEQLRSALTHLSNDPNPKLRSKAIFLLGGVATGSEDLLLEHVLNDSDARVRANAIEVLEEREDPQYISVLTKLARQATNRERANAIKALHRLRVGTASQQLLNMLRDERADHRISAMWALRQIGWWQMLREVGNLAKTDNNVRVRRYATGVLRSVIDIVERERKGKTG